MKTKLWLIVTLCLILPLVLHSNPAMAASPMEITSPQDVELSYGIIQDSNDPQLFVAVVYPNVTSSKVTISTAAFNFSLPANTVTSPSIADAPGNGSFTNITGTWIAQKITPSLYASVGFDAAVMSGRDVYQVVLAPGSATPTLTGGEPVELFSFRIADCNGSTVEMLANNSTLQQAFLSNLGANFNNQMSMSVDGQPAMNQYTGNHPTGASVSCTAEGTAATRFFLPLINR